MFNIKGTILESYLTKLSKKELDELSTSNKIQNSMERQFKLKTFFLQPKIFNKVKNHIDPMWLSHDIYLKGKDYEF